MLLKPSFYADFKYQPKSAEQRNRELEKLYTETKTPVYYTGKAADGTPINIDSFKKTEQYQIIKKQMHFLLTGISKWCRDQGLEKSETWDGLYTLIFDSNTVSNTTLADLFSEGKHALEDIYLYYMNLKKPYPIRDITEMRNFIRDQAGTKTQEFKRCPSGTNNGWVRFAKILLNDNWKQIVFNITFQRIQQIAAEFLQKKGILKDNIGMETHGVTVLCNAIAKEYSIPTVNDPYYPEHLKSSHIEEFKTLVKNTIHTNIFLGILSVLVTKAYAVETAAQLTEFAKGMDEFGSDDKFNVNDLFEIDEKAAAKLIMNGDQKDDFNLSLQLGISLFIRLFNNGYIQANHKKLTDASGNISINILTNSILREWSWDEYIFSWVETFIPREHRYAREPFVRPTLELRKAGDLNNYINLILAVARNNQAKTVEALIKCYVLKTFSAKQPEYQKLCNDLLRIALQLQNTEMFSLILDLEFRLSANEKDKETTVWNLALKWNETTYSYFFQAITNGKLTLEDKFSQQNTKDLIEYIIACYKKFSISIAPFARHINCKTNVSSNHQQLFAEALWSAANKNYSHEALTLVQINADPNFVPAKESNTALHSALTHKDQELYSSLLLAGANPLKANNAGLTPLDLAIFEDDANIVEFMVAFIPGNIEIKSLDDFIIRCSQTNREANADRIIRARLEAAAKQAKKSRSSKVQPIDQTSNSENECEAPCRLCVIS